MKGPLEKMTEAEIGGELVMLYKTMGRASLLSEDQCRIQIYKLLEIEHPNKYRAKLPSSGPNDLTANIL